ncbi:MAG: hypothetical protein M1576_02735 [Deltaproteobacteria bacterium]|uniref:Uncharacterized protein n=1 Tax=Acididesulfobacter guangdongensis TaxID=2597225 RepID=A0A519BIS2_ACIG2|nr:hypothetical protein [Deltaproteobacteria bacterium]RZD17164.1 MAG: hypothetical protein EVJ46_02745 [Candidatus Acididesulfobacter guangdongensis]
MKIKFISNQRGFSGLFGLISGIITISILSAASLSINSGIINTNEMNKVINIVNSLIKAENSAINNYFIKNNSSQIGSNSDSSANQNGYNFYMPLSKLISYNYFASGILAEYGGLKSGIIGENRSLEINNIPIAIKLFEPVVNGIYYFEIEIYPVNGNLAGFTNYVKGIAEGIDDRFGGDNTVTIYSGNNKIWHQGLLASKIVYISNITGLFSSGLSPDPSQSASENTNGYTGKTFYINFAQVYANFNPYAGLYNDGPSSSAGYTECGNNIVITNITDNLVYSSAELTTSTENYFGTTYTWYNYCSGGIPYNYNASLLSSWEKIYSNENNGSSYVYLSPFPADMLPKIQY